MTARRNPRLARLALIAATLGTVVLILWLFVYKPPLAVDLGRVDRGDVEVTVGDDGVARVREIYEVAAPVAGRLLRVEPEVGDAVVANHTVLARLAPVDPGFLDERSRSVAQAQLAEAQARLALGQADIRSAQTAYQLANSEYGRTATLASSGTLSRAALDRARASRDEAAAALAAARAGAEAGRRGVEAAQAQLAAPLARDRAGVIAIRSPVSGTILQIFQESEAIVHAGAPLVAVGNPGGDLEILVDLLSTDAVRIRPGARVYIEEWGGSRTLFGRVRRIEPFGFLKVSALGVEEQRVNVRIDLIGERASWSRLGHGYRVEARIVTGAARGVLRVPTDALFRDGDQWAAYVASQGRARLRRLSIGLANDRFAQVLAGLSSGEQVVLFPGEAVDEGARLKPRRQ